MKTTNNLNLINSMNTKKILKTIFKFSIALGTFIPLINNEKINASTALTACSTSDTVTSMASETDPCYTTPESYKVKFYEIGFCTSDPLASGTFDNSTCHISWKNYDGYTVDLGTKTYDNMGGSTYEIRHGTYGHAYVIMNQKWGLKGKYKLKNGSTYYTKSNGDMTTDESLYDVWEDDINSMQGTETTGLCWDYEDTTDYGTISAVLTDGSNVTASNTATCDSAIRMIGQIDLNTPVVMDSSVRGYKLTWIVTNMGLGVYNDGNVPRSWQGGPFVPSFTMIK